MGLLQDPLAALKQAEWYLENGSLEQFPGAFELAAGNLCRQTLEQILFILCFFSGMPAKRYLRTNRTLRDGAALLQELDKTDHKTGKKYWELARQRNPRIRKFARYPRSLKKWRRMLNEPSHFSVRFRRLDAAGLRRFIETTRGRLDDKDKYLVLAAINEIFSGGRVLAAIGSDGTPGICQKSVVTAHNLENSPDGRLQLRGPSHDMVVIPSNEIPRGPWPRKPVLVQHSVGISIGIQFVKKDGTPVNISNMKGILLSFAKTSGERSYLVHRLRQLGYTISFTPRNQRDARVATTRPSSGRAKEQ